MHISDKEYEIIQETLRQIKSESLRKPPRKNRIWNLSCKISVRLAKAKRKEMNTLNL